jgi:hypothetical protein
MQLFDSSECDKRAGIRDDGLLPDVLHYDPTAAGVLPADVEVCRPAQRIDYARGAQIARGKMLMATNGFSGRDSGHAIPLPLTPDMVRAWKAFYRALPDAELDGFVDALATRMAAFDKWAIAM